jgi:ethanolamine utilization protein EutL
MRGDPVKATVLATKIIPQVDPSLGDLLGLSSGQKSIAILTADSDDVTYTALDEATKMADVKVIFAQSFYGGAANATTKLAGEVIGVLGGPNPEQARSALDSCIDVIENKAHFVSANNDDTIIYFAHCISRTGSYLSGAAGVEEGKALAYLIAPPLEALYALDKALKAANVRMCQLYEPPTKTNFAGALLTGSQADCKSACDAFASAVEYVADNPRQR